MTRRCPLKFCKLRTTSRLLVLASSCNQGGSTTVPPRCCGLCRSNGPTGYSRSTQAPALELLTLGREDLLRSKLFALIDRNIDLPDCVALAPSRDELDALLPWLDEQDGNEQWPDYVRVMLGQLAQELGYEL